FSRSAQHPVQLDFTRPEPAPGLTPKMRFPSLRLLGDRQASEVFQRSLMAAAEAISAGADTVDGELLVNPVSMAIEIGRHARDACLPIEADIARRPSVRKVFSR